MAGSAKRRGLTGLCLLLAALFGALGVWQVQRLQWKTALIAQVEARAGADPFPAPAPDDATGAARAYQAVRVHGLFEHDRETLVQAVTELGPGFWVLTPLRADGGFTVLINRGFVPVDQAATRDWLRPQGPQTVIGLLRLTEPRGGFLRANDPAGDRWRSRDVQAIATARTLSGPVASYFIDAAANDAGQWPRGGLTRLRFTNHHLVYALTWFALCGMSLFGGLRLWRERADGGE